MAQVGAIGSSFAWSRVVGWEVASDVTRACVSWTGCSAVWSRLITGSCCCLSRESQETQELCAGLIALAFVWTASGSLQSVWLFGAARELPLSACDVAHSCQSICP